jgi:hypothetical protein
MIRFGAFIAVVAAAGSVLAADGPVSATLQNPVAKATEQVAGGAVFACKADTCVAESDTSQLDDQAMCKDLARQLGAITKFGSMAAGALAKCNGVAKH